MRKKIVIGNWKMNPLTSKEAEKIFTSISKVVAPIKKTEIAICPPVLFLTQVKKISKKILLGAQDAFYEASGAYTAEISAEMIRSAGAKYVILGHSERRAMGETNENINKKIKASLASGLMPILCVGEKVRDEDHAYLHFVQTQVEQSLNKIEKSALSKIIIAYEPVWAIGKNAAREATAEEWSEMNIFIRKILSDKFGAENVQKIRLIYGGSAHPENVETFLKAGADGFLVGRDSLDPKKFLAILKICEASKN